MSPIFSVKGVFCTCDDLNNQRSQLLYLPEKVVTFDIREHLEKLEPSQPLYLSKKAVTNEVCSLKSLLQKIRSTCTFLRRS